MERWAHVILFLMKKNTLVSLFLILFFSSPAWSISTSTGDSMDYSIDALLNNPNVSDHCKDLLNRRKEKMDVQLKIKDLMRRTKKSIKIADGKREGAKKTLEASFSKLSQNNYLTSLRIKSLEETIIKNGCPGIVLH